MSGWALTPRVRNREMHSVDMKKLLHKACEIAKEMGQGCYLFFLNQTLT